jgi:riboflavin synthase
MFTGIIEEVGEIVEIQDAGDFRTIVVAGHQVFDDLRTGSSIAVNGVCLTARSIANQTFSAEMSRETLDRTSLGSLRKGALVNLERPMRADSRFGGHIVQGHVDGVGRISRFDRREDAWSLEVEYPESGLRYIVEKGSITVDGISLTVATLNRSSFSVGPTGRPTAGTPASPATLTGSSAGPPTPVFSVAIIPHTFEHTNLKTVQTGAAVNLEFDVVAKYIENLLKPYAIRNH